MDNPRLCFLLHWEHGSGYPSGGFHAKALRDILIAAFKSLSMETPQLSQLNVRSDRDNLSFLCPQQLQVLLDGYH